MSGDDMFNFKLNMSDDDNVECEMSGLKNPEGGYDDKEAHDFQFLNKPKEGDDVKELLGFQQNCEYVKRFLSTVKTRQCTGLKGEFLECLNNVKEDMARFLVEEEQGVKPKVRSEKEKHKVRYFSENSDDRRGKAVSWRESDVKDEDAKQRPTARCFERLSQSGLSTLQSFFENVQILSKITIYSHF